MRLVVSTPPASEPLTLAELKSYVRLDGTNAEPAPGALNAAIAAPAAPGNVDNGSHRYLATFVTAQGETDAGVVSAAVVVADKTVNGQVQLTAIPVGGSQVTARKLYRTTAGGAAFLFLATIADNVTAIYTDNTADAALGAGAPVANSTEDPWLVMLLASARQAAEAQLGRFLITQTVDLLLDDFPRYWTRDWIVVGPSPIYPAWPRMPVARDGTIAVPPLQAVTSITYVASDGTAGTVLDPSQYIVDAGTLRTNGRITPAYGLGWPAARCQANGVRVRFTAGYGAAAAVPACIKQWIALQVKTAWDNRDALIAGERGQILTPDERVDGLLDPERIFTL